MLAWRRIEFESAEFETARERRDECARARLCQRPLGGNHVKRAAIQRKWT